MQKRLNFLDRFLTVWIFLAMALGVSLGYFFPGISGFIDSLSVGSANIPLAAGLILMMYPPLAKVDYSLLPEALSDTKAIAVSLLLNWIVGPLLMFFLAVTMLADRPEAMAGLILIGLARCIAMVIVWNDLAGGSRTYAALLVALNSVFQLLAYGFYAWLFVEWLPGTMGMISQRVEVPMGAVASSVLLYLGVPFLAGYLGRFFLVKKKGIDWYNRVYLPKVSPLTLYALLFTIVLMFCLKGDSIVQLPGEVLRVALPLLIYFLSMFVVSFLVCRALGLSYEKNTAISFTATGNNFELAIAVGIAVYGLGSQQAFVGVVGPLVEVPAMILLVRLGRSLQGLLYRS